MCGHVYYAEWGNLLYGDYYEAKWLKNLDKFKLIVMGTYDVGTRGNSGSDAERLVEYILDESNWTSVSNSFSIVYPQRCYKGD